MIHSEEANLLNINDEVIQSQKLNLANIDPVRACLVSTTSATVTTPPAMLAAEFADM
jgi:hypothetical protein